MSPFRNFLPSLTALSLLAALTPSLFGQAAGDAPQAKITGIEAEFVKSPEASGSGYKKTGEALPWLEVEVQFSWASKADPEGKIPRDELKVNYFVLLKNKATPDYPKPVLLVGSVEHVKVVSGDDLKSAIFAAPRDLQHILGEKLPARARPVIAGVGVTIEYQGQVVASDTTEGSGTWWEDQADQFQRVDGVLVDKSKTPFAAMAWDYHEPLKSN